MDIFDQKHALESMKILVDTREQNTKEARRRFERFRCPFSRATLNYGDYTFNFNLPDGQPFLDVRNTVKPPVVIERKASLGELAKCLVIEETSEMIRALDAGIDVGSEAMTMAVQGAADLVRYARSQEQKSERRRR